MQLFALYRLLSQTTAYTFRCTQAVNWKRRSRFPTKNTQYINRFRINRANRLHALKTQLQPEHSRNSNICEIHQKHICNCESEWTV